MIGALARKIFGTPNDRLVRTYLKRVEPINALEPQIAPLSDDEMRARIKEMKAEVAAGKPLDACLDEYASLDVWLLDNQRNITFV